MTERWKRMWFKRNKVWVAVGTDGQPAIAGGRATVRYRREDEREYRVNPANLAPLENEPPDAAETTAGAEKPTRKKKALPQEAVVAYTDGASSGNPGPSGIGVLLRWGDREKEISRFIGTATNNIAELEAIRAALDAVKNPHMPLIIYTDSGYAYGLLALGWKAKKNTALVEEIRSRMSSFSRVELVKVRGHAGDEGNERADRLATAAIRSGVSRP